LCFSCFCVHTPYNGSSYHALDPRFWLRVVLEIFPLPDAGQPYAFLCFSGVSSFSQLPPPGVDFPCLCICLVSPRLSGFPWLSPALYCLRFARTSFCLINYLHCFRSFFRTNALVSLSCTFSMGTFSPRYPPVAAFDVLLPPLVVSTLLSLQFGLVDPTPNTDRLCLWIVTAVLRSFGPLSTDRVLIPPASHGCVTWPLTTT